MIRPHATGELNRLRAVQNSAMQDTCVHMVYGASVDAYNDTIEDWVDGDTLACGYTPGEPEERRSMELVSNSFLGVLRLPTSKYPDLSEKDRYRITHVAGVVLPVPLLFDTNGPPRLTVTAVYVDVERIKPQVNG